MTVPLTSLSQQMLLATSSWVTRNLRFSSWRRCPTQRLVCFSRQKGGAGIGQFRFHAPCDGEWVAGQQAGPIEHACDIGVAPTLLILVVKFYDRC